MRKLIPEERLKHGVIVLLKKEDYEDLKRFAEESNTSQAAWARKLVLQGLQRTRRIEKNSKEAIAHREAELELEAAEREAAAREAAARSVAEEARSVAEEARSVAEEARSVAEEARIVTAKTKSKSAAKKSAADKTKGAAKSSKSKSKK